MKINQKLMFVGVVLSLGSVYANTEIPSALKDDIASLKQVSNLVAKVVTELSNVEIATTQTALASTKKGLESILQNMYDLVSPLVASQTVYKSLSGQNYIIPTASVPARQQFDIASFEAKNKEVMERNNNSQDSQVKDEQESEG